MHISIVLQVALLATYPLKTLYTLAAIDASPAAATAAPCGALSAAAKRRLLLQLLTSPRRSLAEAVARCRLLYAGLQPAAIETPISSLFFFYLYSTLRRAAAERQRRRRAGSGRAGSGGGARAEQLGAGTSLLIAAAAAAANHLLTSPLQVITTQMQARARARREGGAAACGSAVENDSMWAVAKEARAACFAASPLVPAAADSPRSCIINVFLSKMRKAACQPCSKACCRAGSLCLAHALGAVTCTYESVACILQRPSSINL